MELETDLYKLLDRLFPFFFVTDRNGNLLKWGRSLEKIAPRSLVQGSFNQFFTLKKPSGKVWHDLITSHRSEMIVLGVNNVDAEVMGQVMDIDDESKMVFVVNLVVKDASKLKDLKLTFSDFAIQDPIFDFLMLLQTQNRAIKQAEIMNEKLAEANRIAIKASETKSQFLANMSHELRTPMNGLLGMAHLLMDTKLDDEQQDYVKTLVTSGESMLSLVNDILDLSKIEAGFIQLSTDQFNFGELIDEVCSTVFPLVQKKNLHLEKEVLGLPEGLIQGDRLRLRQVFLNILGNAVKFTSEGQVRLFIQARPEVNSKKVSLKIEITDSGIGMTPETIAQLFKPFVQADSSMTKKFEGTGLGLSICKKLVDSMGGKVAVTSELGKGSKFSIDLDLDLVA